MSLMDILGIISFSCGLVTLVGSIIPKVRERISLGKSPNPVALGITGLALMVVGIYSSGIVASLVLAPFFMSGIYNQIR